MKTLPSIQDSLPGLEDLMAEAVQLRRDIVLALYQAQGGHYGGCLSVLDILLSLYRFKLRTWPDCPLHPNRDRLVLSKGHAALALYAILRHLGFFDWPLEAYGSFLSPLEGHPDMASTPGVDFSTGSLGQGLSVGLGMAMGLRARNQQVWVILGDGECQEGQVWEAAMLASTLGLANLYAVVDCNGHQEWGHRQPAVAGVGPPVPDMLPKWTSFGWAVRECDGHDFASLRHCFCQPPPEAARPTVILARTVKGKGVPLAESDPRRFHCTSVSAAEQTIILESLNTV